MIFKHKKTATFTHALRWLLASGHLTAKPDVNRSGINKMPHLIPACNEDLHAANTAVIAGGFSLIQPDSFEIEYGEYPHSVGVQIFDRASAQAMANDMASLLGKLSRGFRGIPVYAGHPDHPDQRLAAQYPDRKARGWITEIVVGDNSARFLVSYNSLGKSEVEDAQWAGYSPLWLMQPAANQRGKFRPMILKSMALTNNPNMPVKPLIVANEEEATALIPTPTPMKPKTIAKLKKLLKLPEEADDTALDQAANDYCDKAMAPEPEPKPEVTPEAVVEVEPPTPEADKKEDAKEAANEAISAMRGALINFGLDQLIMTGRLAASRRDIEHATLVACANDAAITAHLDTLRGAKPVMQTKPVHAANIALQKPAFTAANVDTDRARQRTDAVNAIKAERPGISGTVAWGMAASRNPELFGH